MPASPLPFLDALLAGEDEPARRGDPAGRGGPARRGEPARTGLSRAGATRTLRDALRRDLALLFATRPRRRSAPAHLAELHASVLACGLPDLNNLPVGDEAGREALRAGIEAQVRRFEPRLAAATVEGPEDHGRRLRFRIRAALRTEGGAEPVAFDLDLATRGLSVADASGGEG